MSKINRMAGQAFSLFRLFGLLIGVSFLASGHNVQDQFESDAGYYKALGYREEDGKMESTDDYVARMAAYMTFYGAMVQVWDLSLML